MEFFHHKTVVTIRITPDGPVWVATKRKVTFIGPDVMGTREWTTTQSTHALPDGTLIHRDGETDRFRVDHEGILQERYHQKSTRAEIVTHAGGRVTALVREVETEMCTCDDGTILQMTMATVQRDSIDLQPGLAEPTRVYLTEGSSFRMFAELSPLYAPLFPSTLELIYY